MAVAEDGRQQLRLPLFYLSFSPAHSSRIVTDVVLLAALINRVGWRLSDAL